MPPLITLDGSHGEGGGQILRTALTLSAVTGQPFAMTRIRAGRVQPGLRPQHVAAVRAAAMACGARVGGAFEGSPDLRFAPGAISGGEFRFEIGTAGAVTLVLQTLLPILAAAGVEGRVEVTGGTHVPRSPSYHFLARHWLPMVQRIGLNASLGLVRAGFYPRGGGEARADVLPGSQGGTLSLEARGRLVGIRGLSGAGRLRGEVARRQRDGAQERLWEQRRLEAEWDVIDVPAASPGSFLLLEAVFEHGRAAFGSLGEKRVKAEVLGDRTARRLLGFLDSDGAVDPHLADQLAVPLAVSRQGGRISTTEVTGHLETVAAVLTVFGVAARTWGRRGGPGGLEVDRC